jgi:NAD(P)-dependent dehydrogenase (short-subunit alcohol dehydrogenase family)
MNILISGASRGLGLFLAQKYLEDGHTVYAGVRDINAPLLAKLPGNVIPVALDVTDTASVNRAASTVDADLDVLINNAGVHCDSSFEPLEQTDLDECAWVYDVNAVGPLRVIKAFLPKLKDGAKIISISSESGSIGATGRQKEFDYCMSKAALNMGAKLIQTYVKYRGIKVMAIQPGWMRTDMGGQGADLDPYETACELVELFNGISGTDGPIFIDRKGIELPW